MHVLVTAASKHGATDEIAAAIGQTLSDQGLEVSVHIPEVVEDIAQYDAVVLGSAVYSGHWLEPATALVERSADALASRPVWLFSSGPVGDPTRKLAQKMAVDPVELPALTAATHAREHRMFGGKLDKHDLPWAQRAALTLVRGLDGDFRPWPEIEQWAGQIATALRPGRDGDGRAA